MISFENDYSVGAHISILDMLRKTNFEPLSGYSTDKYSLSAKEKIKKACDCDTADVHFLVGGTQTNKVVISSMLNDFEGVISAESGHINTHEAGAVESTGHKVIELPHNDGKLSCETIQNYLDEFFNDKNHEHAVYPGMVYISHPTEYGTLYTKAELTAISSVLKSYNIPLYLDGARLGYALASDTDLTLCDIARLCDVFYIGGTKVGALCGEAVVFTKNNTPKHFMTTVKQHGALLAKGRLLGVQFDTLFTDDLYIKISKNAIEKANALRAVFESKGYSFYVQSPTNQIFVILDNKKMSDLEKEVSFSFWQRYDDSHTVVRFATSWATTDEEIKKLSELL